MALRVELQDESPEAINTYLYERRMTDGLPVIPPTEERVAAMVAASGRHRDDVIGEFPPLWAPATVEKIAINAVMAGCEPAYMPALIASVQGILADEFDAFSVQTTTNAVSPVLIFNGPIRQKLAINCGAGCFGPGFKANATIGRAIRLIMINIGGGTPGDVDKATMGWSGKFSCCIGENEEESPWEPFHVDRGFRPTDSTVTVVPANGIWAITEPVADSEMILHHITKGMVLSGFLPHGELVLALNPVWAKVVAGLKPTKKEFQAHLFENALVPVDWFTQAARDRSASRGFDVSKPTRPMCSRPEDFIVVVAGGQGSLHASGLSVMFGRAVTKKIEES